MGKNAGRLIAAVAFFILSVTFSFGQTFSSYSILGIGDIYEPALTPNQGMGGLGISNSNIFYGNIANPALIAENSFYSFAAGFVGEDRTIIQGDSEERATGAILSNLSAVYPIKPGKVSMGLSLLPFSRVKYDFGNVPQIDGDATSIVTSSGSGGFNQLMMNLGYKPIGGLYVGGSISYLFSSIVREASTALVEPEGVYTPVSNYRLTANDFLYRLGAAYAIPVAQYTKLNIGATYQFASTISVEENQYVENRSLLNIPISIDTVLIGEKGTLEMPAFYGFGLSLKKQTQNTIWTIGADLKFQQFSQFRNVNGTNPFYTDALLLTLGGEITPNLASVENYFARITYRAGFNYNQTPYVIDGIQIDEYGINFGFSFPITSFSSIDLGLRYGQRGTTDNNLIQENFLRLNFGVTFNDGRWFQRPKFN